MIDGKEMDGGGLEVEEERLAGEGGREMNVKRSVAGRRRRLRGNVG